MLWSIVFRIMLWSIVFWSTVSVVWVQLMKNYPTHYCMTLCVASSWLRDFYPPPAEISVMYSNAPSGEHMPCYS